MSPTEVPRDVARFLRAHIRSVLQLEMLMLLRRDPERHWSASALDKELRSSLAATLENLRALQAHGLVEVTSESEPRYRYRLSSSNAEQTMLELSQLLQTHYHVVIHAIYAGRRRDVEQFADAFKIKKDGGDDDG